MCTVVVRWAPGRPVLLLALRDELTGRPFDDPDTWWPEQPTAVGGRDRQAGGSWCVSDTATGVSALVLNRPQRRLAAPAAPSRGVLPLLALQHLEDWPQHLDVAGMASFALVLAAPARMASWEFDGERLTRRQWSPGTHMVTAGVADEDKIARHLPSFVAGGTAEQWQAIATGSTAGDDPTSLLVRVQREGLTYATVLAQVIEAEPGRVRLSYSRTPVQPGVGSTDLACCVTSYSPAVIEMLRERIQLTVDGRTARLVLARPETGNALDLEMALALQEAGERLQATPDLAVVRVSARGRMFCVGGDLREFAGTDEPGSHLAAVAAAAHAGLTALRELPCPVVSVVQGTAAGGGVGVALVADLVLMAASARFVAAYTAAGLSPDCGLSWTLPRALGPAVALDLLLTNRPLSAAEALAYGLVSRVVEDAELEVSAAEVVAALAAGPTHAYVEARRLARLAPSRAWQEHLDDEAGTIARLSEEPDGREGVRAFLDKRPADFGRGNRFGPVS